MNPFFADQREDFSIFRNARSRVYVLCDDVFFFFFFSRHDGGERREDRLAASFCIIFSPRTINHPLGLAGWFMFCPRETHAFVADRRSRAVNRYAPDNSRINFPRCSRVCIIISRGQFHNINACMCVCNFIVVIKILEFSFKFHLIAYNSRQFYRILVPKHCHECKQYRKIVKAKLGNVVTCK